ncbi:serine/threonine-protein kinase [Nocardia sp. GCM10030253]|uniref:serine/threonine-protein kinase n=1 Tax=Nocardia sp. GCM10030253 TaxID=3273404 RepID=UPI003628EB5A
MSLHPGAQFEGYVVRAPLGRGGSSDVYLVDDPGHSRQAVLKILDHPVGDLSTARRQFHNDFDIASTLHHPNVVEMLAQGEFLGQPWLTYAYGEREPGSTLIPGRRDEVDLTRALPALAEIAAALDYIHQHDVLHLDVKPHNMLIGLQGATTVLTDFGIAHRLSDDTPLAGPDGFVPVSLAYAAPEVLRGAQIYPATDQYSLACAVVEFLTGRPPFPMPNQFAIADAHLWATPPDVSWRRPWIPHAVDSILDKALAKDPRARYDSCAEPIHLITRVLRDVEQPRAHR